MSECSQAHPPAHCPVDTENSLVTVCVDFIKGKCARDNCKYFHPPEHLVSQLKKQKINNNVIVAAAQAAQQQQTAVLALNFLPTYPENSSSSQLITLNQPIQQAHHASSIFYPRPLNTNQPFHHHRPYVNHSNYFGTNSSVMFNRNQQNTITTNSLAYPSLDLIMSRNGASSAGSTSSVTSSASSTTNSTQAISSTSSPSSTLIHKQLF